METKILVLGNAPLVDGFRLSGIKDARFTPPEHFSKELEKSIDSKEFGIILVSDSYLQGVDWKLKKKIDSIAFPVVVGLPDAGGKEQPDEIRALIKRALGFDLAAKK